MGLGRDHIEDIWDINIHFRVPRAAVTWQLEQLTQSVSFRREGLYIGANGRPAASQTVAKGSRQY